MQYLYGIYIGVYQFRHLNDRVSLNTGASNTRLSLGDLMLQVCLFVRSVNIMLRKLSIYILYCLVRLLTVYSLFNLNVENGLNVRFMT